MTLQQRDAFLAEQKNAVVGINRPDAGPQLTPVWFVWDGQTFIFSTTRDRAKYPNIRRDPRISLIVDDPEQGYIVAYGRAEILERDFAERVRPIIEKYNPDEIEQGMAMITAPNRVLVVLHPEKWVTSDRS
jgi:PPOX class probable F420-dependent enzyme